jgi:hypothetical protein
MSDKKMPRGALAKGGWVKCWGCKMNMPREDAYLNPHAPVLGNAYQCKDSASCATRREKRYNS